MASTASRLWVPRATSGWLVTTISRRPAAARRRQASATPGRTRSSATSAGGYGRPSTTRAALSDAVAVQEHGGRRCMPRASARRSASIACIDCLQGPARARRSAPSPAPGCGRCEPHDGDIALPAPVRRRRSARRRRAAPTTAPRGQLGDLAHRDVVAGRDVVGVERLGPGGVDDAEHGAHDVGDEDVGLALRAVAQDRRRSTGPRAAGARSRSRRRGSGGGRRRCRSGRRGPADPEHVRVGADQRLAGELAGAVGRDRDERAVVLGRLVLAEVAVDAAARTRRRSAARRCGASPRRRGG